MPIDGFLKLEGIEGECKDADHPKWIDVCGFSWSMSQEVVPAADGTIAAGVPSVQAFEFTQPFSRASVGIFEACCRGRQIPEAVFESRLNNGDRHFTHVRVEFKDCLVASVQTSGAGAEVTERIEVAFRAVEVVTNERPL